MEDSLIYNFSTMINEDYENAVYPEKISDVITDSIVYSIAALCAVFNLGAFVTILVTKKLTKTPKYLLIINMNIMFLILGLFVITGEHRKAGNGNCGLYYYAVLFEYFSVGVILSLSVLLNIDYIIRIVKSQFYATNKKYILFGILLFLVYLINALLIVPYYTDKYVIQERRIGHHKTFCAVVFPSFFDMSILLILSSVPQAIFVITTLVLAICVYASYKKSQINTPTPTELFVLDVILIMFCIGPPLASVLNSATSIYIFLLIWILPFCMTIIVPLIFLINQEYRQAVKDLLCCRCRKSKDSDSYEMM